MTLTEFEQSLLTMPSWQRSGASMPMAARPVKLNTR